MIHPVVHGFVFTSILYILDVIFSWRKDMIRYAIIFLTIAGSAYYTRGLCHAGEIEIDYHTYRYFEPQPPESLDRFSQESFEESIEYHFKESLECFDGAWDLLCWCDPKADNYEKANLCFLTAIAALVPGTPIQKAAAGIVILLDEYGIGCMIRWRKVQSLLLQTEYHYDWYEFLQEIYISRFGKKHLFILKGLDNSYDRYIVCPHGGATEPGKCHCYDDE